MDDPRLKEWEVTRDTIAKFDDRLHDLRKYGFSFLTGLLTAESILIPTAISASFGEAGIPSWIKFSVLLVTLQLIVALRLLDRNYGLFIKACAQRALILERTLDLELTEVITLRHSERKIPLYERAVYISFALAVGVLGVALFWPDDPVLSAASLLAAFLVALLTSAIGQLDLRPGPRGEVDWTLSATECEQGDDVAITLTNMSKEADLVLQSGLIGSIREQNGEAVFPLEVVGSVRVPPEGNYCWIWKPPLDVRPGVYQVVPGRESDHVWIHPWSWEAGAAPPGVHPSALPVPSQPSPVRLRPVPLRRNILLKERPPTEPAGSSGEPLAH